MIFSDLLIPYGRHRTSNRMLHASEVPAGLACNCVCPSCAARLIARHGHGKANSPQDHFAHEAVNPNCSGALESSLHFAAKQIIDDAGWLMLPALYPRHPNGRPSLQAASPAARATLTARHLEFTGFLPAFKPDVFAMHDDQPLVIEIHVAHAVEAAKLDHIRRRDLAAVEIVLGDFRNAPREAWTRAVLQTAPRHWLHHPRQAGLDAALTARIAAERELRLRETQEAEAHRHERLRQLDAERAEREARWVLEDADRQAAVEAENQRRRETEAQRRAQDAMLDTYRHQLAVASARSAVEAYERCWQSVPDGAAVLQRAHDRLKAVEEGRPWP